MSMTTPRASEDGAEVGKAAGVARVALGEEHGAAVDQWGRLFTWGAGDFGQLGTGSGGNSASPVQIDGAGTVVDVAAST